ncbi:TIGR03790 family protein [Planctomycetota bacterium]
MKTKFSLSVLALLFFCGAGFALEPDEILIIANADIADSVELAEYYCQKRNVPKKNILALKLGAKLEDTISRKDYEKKLAEPIRRKLHEDRFRLKIRCLLTVYGVPFKVGNRAGLNGQQERIKELEQQLEQEKKKIYELGGEDPELLSRQQKQSKRKQARLQSAIDSILGKETHASVDSELSMVAFDSYELYRWQPNRLKDTPYWDLKSLMVSRLDGPDVRIAKGLIDKAMAAELKGLKGRIYIDSRGLAKDKKRYSFGAYDQSLRDLVLLAELRSQMPVRHEQTEKLFKPGSCPDTVIYCGWYSLKKYIDAFDFADGAIGYHIASWEAIDIRDANSSQWCPAMLVDGVTATLGAVAEPYLHSFPKPKELFGELFYGSCLVEAFYYTKPFNSWQMVLIGDPLYRPFEKR